MTTIPNGITHQILHDAWVLNLRKQQEIEPMDNDYKKELEDLELIYGATIERIDQTYDNKIELLVNSMADFVDCHKARKQYKKKLAVLQAKLKSEGYDEENEDGDERCCGLY